MENLARRSIYVLAALIASMLCWFAFSSSAQATSHYTTDVKDGCTLTSYAPYKSYGYAKALQPSSATRHEASNLPEAP